MKTFEQYINEAKQNYIFGGTDDRNVDAQEYKYFPKDREELGKYMKEIFDKDGNDGNFNIIDTSAITDFTNFFMWSSRYTTCDLSGWDTSNVTNMEYMFSNSSFNGDISQWDVSNVTSMRGMFSHSPFNGDISKWDVSKVTNMNNMFFNSKFNQDLSEWKPLKLKKNTNKTFGRTPISAAKKYPQWYLDLKDDAWFAANGVKR
jgi:surface protein